MLCLLFDPTENYYRHLPKPNPITIFQADFKSKNTSFFTKPVYILCFEMIFSKNFSFFVHKFKKTGKS